MGRVDHSGVVLPVHVGTRGCMASFGTPGPYGKFYTNHKETPWGNVLNARSAIKREDQIIDIQRACPSPWLHVPTEQHFKEHTDLPIQHPHAGGLRWHTELRTQGPEIELDKSCMAASAGEETGIFTLAKPFRVGYGDSFGFSVDIEMEEGGYVAFGICPPHWDFNTSLQHKGAACVRSDGAFCTADADGVWSKSQCNPLLCMGGSVFD